MVAATRKSALAGALGAARARLAFWPAGTMGRHVALAFEVEWEQRRFFLWLPVLAGTGVLLFLAADQNPVLWLPVMLTLAFAVLAIVARNHRAGFLLAMALAATFGGFSCAALRTRLVAAPVLDRIRIVKLTGYVEEVDHRRLGSRFILAVRDADGLDPEHRPDRVRLTTRRGEPVEAGDFVGVTARLLPPAQASLPGGYAFARDAYFAGIGAVGSVLGRLRPAAQPSVPAWGLAAHMAIDRARNGLAGRVDAILGGDTGAIAAAMVTGKRDLLSADGRDLIREAGIFHIITIAGVQMTLVAGLLFGGVRRALALSRTLALTYPIKKWAALVAIVGAVGYDILTGSRIGTQRALFMTLVMLGAVLVDRRGFTMRNLALAALAVILVEPESITGASFQLSFAAVAALVAVYEARERARSATASDEGEPRRGARSPTLWRPLAHGLGHGRDLMLATLFATAATASFMAANFHELSPYVLLGNPLTLAIIEFFAVPGALLGSVLYPLGLDGPVWHWVGAGIGIVLWAARLIAAAPASTVHLPAFASWSLGFLALAVLSAVLWRTWTFRLSAVPLLVIGLLGTALGPRYDLIVPATGDAVAIRGTDGLFAVAGKTNAFALEQWLRADGDGRDAAVRGGAVSTIGRCDRLACVAPLPGDQTLSLVADPSAFEEDCRRADVIVSPLYAPESCAAPLIIDRGSLASTGALGLRLRNGGWVADPSRTATADRPWSPLPHVVAPRRSPAAEGEPPNGSTEDAVSSGAAPDFTAPVP